MDLPRRRSVRLKGYDYSRSGAYFVTICTEGRRRLLGEVVDGAMRLDARGAMVASSLKALSERFPRVALDVSVVMPDHLHAVWLLGSPFADAGGDDGDGGTLGDLVRAFKSLTTVSYIRGVESLGWSPFHRRFWQRGYYEHIVRGEASLQRIRKYVVDNPARWRG